MPDPRGRRGGAPRGDRTAGGPPVDPPGRPRGGAGPAGLDRRLRRALAARLDLPLDIVLDLPRLTMVGDIELTVENHQGVREFRSDRLVVATRSGLLRVEGEGLRLTAVRPGEVVVSGLLRAVVLLP